VDTLVFMLLFCFFRLVSKQIYSFQLFRLFRNGLKIPKQTETNRNKSFLVSRNKPKINRNRFSFGLFRFEPKNFIVCFENTLVFTFLPLMIYMTVVIIAGDKYYHNLDIYCYQLYSSFLRLRKGGNMLYVSQNRSWNCELQKNF
jgi:hypothetical protein